LRVALGATRTIAAIEEVAATILDDSAVRRTGNQVRACRFWRHARMSYEIAHGARGAASALFGLARTRVRHGPAQAGAIDRSGNTRAYVHRGGRVAPRLRARLAARPVVASGRVGTAACVVTRRSAFHAPRSVSAVTSRRRVRGVRLRALLRARLRAAPQREHAPYRKCDDPDRIRSSRPSDHPSVVRHGPPDFGPRAENRLGLR
jgi:hypothetical protein